ncbi:hypothetical protein CHU92_07075 [Flavobacterium cyanobacteriorum]|uniref:DUF2141 domain-containing protein n=1 Tax=Flavobacterium cyanobacteriorum TaxID=2022802 RepID=A0A255Z937_9FLAO|nr:DUF2141 domain-containing protein [Flavobacterium cyanobacteriorum]OYQ37978.1 hypothetical protein CHU92_07075 [Flavobacterium cyanobacteriorum]
MNWRTLMSIGCLLVSLLSYTNKMQDSGNTGMLTVAINGLSNEKGSVLVSLFDNKQDFPKEASRAVRREKLEIAGGTASITFKDVPYGTYAVAILHDENDNLKMDFNVLGIPKEGYGFSNNAKGSLGPPSFEKAAVILNNSKKTIRIRMRYFL